ncbi:MAG: UDP-N-acetylmuramoyl-L-alanine--D-glutamate ligase [Steroidobacteraceae bacterium]
MVVGLGRTGLSCARFLAARGERVVVTDSRREPPELAALQALATRVEAHVGGFDERVLEGARQVVVSPGVSLDEPFLKRARERGLEIVGDIELFARAVQGPVVGVTGTNGKSTATTLIARMAQADGRRVRAGGNLGEPALDLLAGEVSELYVLELSSYQLETTHTLKLRAATILNVTPDHLDRYATLEVYAAAKARILERCDIAVLNAGDETVMRLARPGQRTVTFSIDPQRPADYGIARDGAAVTLVRRGRPLIATGEMKIAGLHNAANALAALAVGEAIGLRDEHMLAALREFPGLDHRTQWVADIGGVRFIDDSKGTNVGATLAAVEGFPGPLVMILGGDGKNQDFAPLAAAFRGKVHHAVLIGRDAPKIAEALRGVCPLSTEATMESAVRRAHTVARPADTVLLSPACASFDMFRDYHHRGAVFAAAVKGLAA